MKILCVLYDDPKDGIFNKDTAKSFRDNILSKGNLAHPMELYKSFMGREPDVDALLKRDGLLNEKKKKGK